MGVRGKNHYSTPFTMNQIFFSKPRVHTRLSPLGSPTQLVSVGGSLFELRRHKMMGLNLQESRYPLGLSKHSPLPHAAPIQGGCVQNFSGSGAKARKTQTKKKLSSILNGGALAPL